MADIRTLFADYASFHQTKGNKVFHRLGIPLIMLTLLGLLSRAVIFRGAVAPPPFNEQVNLLDAGMVLIAIATIVYLILDWRLALLMLPISVALYVAGTLMPLWLNLALFILGWIFQFVGHSVYEHKSPAFLKNFMHLLVGPLWILNDLVPVVK
jgi:uncharacterized membrane protein YGL010W